MEEETTECIHSNDNSTLYNGEGHMIVKPENVPAY